MNIVMIDRILELTEKPSRFQKIREMSKNWKAVIFTCVLFLTAKIAAEQLALILIKRIN